MALKDLKKNTKSTASKQSTTKKSKKSSVNKVTLIERIAEQTGAPKNTCKAIVESFCDVVSSALHNKEEVALTGFGTFKVTERKARTGTNPTTGQAMQIKAKSVPKFNAGKNLKHIVSGE